MGDQTIARTRQADGQQIRSIVGKRIIQAIRFPVIQLDQFISVVRDSKVLTN